MVGLAWLHALRVAPQVPKGQSVRFQAHSMDFLDLAASMGPKFLLESAMRNYSGLVKGETILVAFGGDKYAWWCGAGVATAVPWLTLASCVAVCRHYLDIADVEPEDMVTLFGNLDLEVTISPPKGMVCATTPCHADTIAWGRLTWLPVVCDDARAGNGSRPSPWRCHAHTSPCTSPSPRACTSCRAHR